MLAVGLFSAVVSIVADIKTWFTPPLPQRQAVEMSGGTHHRVDAGSVEFVLTVSQPRVTVVRAKAPFAWLVYRARRVTSPPHPIDDGHQTAKLRHPATLEAVDFTHPRRLNRQQVLTLEVAPISGTG